MIKVEEALRSILSYISLLSTEEVPLTLSLGRVLAQDIFSDLDIPLLNNSAMDGYAINSMDSRGASPQTPKTLKVIEELKAGMISSLRIKGGEAIKVMTGVPIPHGANAVVMVEDTKRQGGEVKIFKEVAPNENIRMAGEDIKKGELVIENGTLLKPAHIGMLAALGIPQVKVRRKPGIAILTTGDELCDVEEKSTPGKIRTSNTYTLYSQVLSCGGIPHNIGIARDEMDDIEEKIKSGLSLDAIITSGGVSMGDYDLIREVLLRMGAEIKFWKVAMRPGKPVLFGVLEGKPVFALPGNPVSSMICFEMFVRPAILRMLGQKDDMRHEVEAVLEEDIEKKKGLRFFLRAQTRWKDGVYFTKTTGLQGSAILRSMMLANSLIILPEDEEYIRRGTKVSVRFLN